MTQHSAPPTPMQTVVVHVEQLTPENMSQLSEAGYTILRDPALLIFGRPVPEAQQVAATLPAHGEAPGSNGYAEAGHDLPSLPPRP